MQQHKYLGKILFAGLIASLVILNLHVLRSWPDPYRYEENGYFKGSGPYPLRINRFTGERDIELPDSGWFRLLPNGELGDTGWWP